MQTVAFNERAKIAKRCLACFLVTVICIVGPDPLLAQNPQIEAGIDRNETTLETLAPEVVNPGPKTAPDPFPNPWHNPQETLRWLLEETEQNNHDLSPIGMYRAADRVVKLVMLGLLLASIVTWIIWLAKTLELWWAKRIARRSLRVLAASETLQQVQHRLPKRRGVVALMANEASLEVRHAQPSVRHVGGAGLKERVAAACEQTQARAGRRIARGTGVLATIGSVAPFVGLFGTVWGIMNSFVSIAESNTTNLAVVAPGIAEALLATALGLVAAIPAVAIYNMLARSTSGYRLILTSAAERIARLVSRDLDTQLAALRVAARPLPESLK